MTEKERLPLGRRSRLDVGVSSCFGPQTTDPVRFIPLLQQLRQRGEQLLLQVVHAAAVQLMGFRVLADGQAVHEPLLNVRLVILQHRRQRVVQKLKVLFQFGEVTSGDGGVPLLVHAEMILGQIETIVLAELFGVCKVGGRRLIGAGIVFRILFRALFADWSTHTVLSKIGDDRLGDLHIGNPFVLGFPLTVDLHASAEGALAQCEVLRNLGKRIGAQDDRLLAGFSILYFFRSIPFIIDMLSIMS